MSADAATARQSDPEGALYRAFLERSAPLPASDFCRTTFGVSFYDSIVVFERRRRPEPWRDIR